MNDATLPSDTPLPSDTRQKIKTERKNADQQQRTAGTCSCNVCKNEKDISSRRSSKMVLRFMHVKMSFSQNERVFIVRVYYETCSYKSVCEQFTKKFVGRESPTKSSICWLMRKFESTGNVGHAGYQRALTILTPARLEEVATAYEEMASLSLRHGTQQLDISYGSLQTACLKDSSRA